jgi:hypothetical protein
MHGTPDHQLYCVGMDLMDAQSAGNQSSEDNPQTGTASQKPYMHDGSA